MGRGKMGEEGQGFVFVIFQPISLFFGLFCGVFWIKNPQEDGSVLLDPLEFGDSRKIGIQAGIFLGFHPILGGILGIQNLSHFPSPFLAFPRLGAPEDNGNPINYRDPINGINSQLSAAPEPRIWDFPPPKKSPPSRLQGRSGESPFPKWEFLGKSHFGAILAHSRGWE